MKPLLLLWVSPGTQWPQYSMFVTTRILPKIGCVAELSNQTIRTLVREVSKNPMVPLTELQMFCAEMGEPSGKRNISVTQVFMVECYMKATVCTEVDKLLFSERKRKYSEARWHKTKVFGQSSKHNFWWTPGTAPMYCTNTVYTLKI